jgi:hypothetical protein
MKAKHQARGVAVKLGWLAGMKGMGRLWVAALRSSPMRLLATTTVGHG